MFSLIGVAASNLLEGGTGLYKAIDLLLEDSGSFL